MGLMCLPLVADGQSFPKIVGAGVWGPEEAQAGKEYTYKIVWDVDADKVTQSDKSLIQWDVENGTILKKDGLVPSATIKWNEGISQGKIIATYVKDMSISRKKVFILFHA